MRRPRLDLLAYGNARKRHRGAQGHSTPSPAPGPGAASGSDPLAGAVALCALPGLRRGAPGRRAPAMGHILDLLSLPLRTQALSDFDADVLAANSGVSTRALLSTSHFSGGSRSWG